MSQMELARRIGVSATALNLIESGKTADPGVSRIVRIAETLNVTPDQLLGFDAPQQSPRRAQRKTGQQELWPAMPDLVEHEPSMAVSLSGL
jgi:transcriptional regulator with XRE-family HTH domain